MREGSTREPIKTVIQCSGLGRTNGGGGVRCTIVHSRTVSFATILLISNIYKLSIHRRSA